MDTNELANKVSTALVSSLSQPNMLAEANKLRGVIESKLKGNVVAESAWNDFVKIPNDEDNAAAFRKELKKLLVGDADFAVQLLTLVSHVALTNVSVGQGGVAVGGDVKGNIVMGNNNTISTSNQSGGVNISGGTVNVDGDIVGRDKKTND